MKNLKDMAMRVAFESIVKHGKVTRDELTRWNVDFKFDSRKHLYTFTFRNANRLRIIEVKVLACMEACEDNGVKMSVEITKVIADGKNTLTSSIAGDVYLDAPKQKPGAARLKLRRCAA